MTPTVSVVMGAYNEREHLADAIRSILLQQGPVFELVIVNDGSTDSTAEVLSHYRSRDQRVRVFEHENQGLTSSLIRGCQEARGQYIARQDPDDISLPGRLDRLTRRLESDTSLAFVSSWAEKMGPMGEVFDELRRPADPEEATQCLMHEKLGPPGHGSVMFRKSDYLAVGGYREEFYYGQDSDLWLRLVSRGLIAYEQDVLYRYRYRPNGISIARRRVQKEFGRIGRECFQTRMRGEEDYDLLREAAALRDNLDSSYSSWSWRRSQLAAGCYLIASGLQRRKDRRAVRYLWQAILASPFHWRAWVRLLVSPILLCQSPGRMRLDQT